MYVEFMINVGRLFVLMRADIRNARNTVVNDDVLHCLAERRGNADLLSLIEDEGLVLPDEYALVQTNRADSDVERARYEAIRGLLIDVCERLRWLIEGEQWEQAYDLVDAVHFLPEVYIQGCLHEPKAFWRIYLSRYQRKWGTRCFRAHRDMFRST